jgi:hypothetical protein
MQTDPKLLIKFPTRERPEKFFNVLNKYIEKAHDISKIAFLISMDHDDATMHNEVVIAKLKDYQKKVKLVYFFGNSKTKMEAINADVEKVSGWDILLLASDDMIPVVQGYDYIIRKDMNDHFRDMDGALWYSDGGQNNICTLSILGKKYYSRFGYIYNPDYISLWCDNEYTDVMIQLNKCYKSDRIIIEHQHPVYQKSNYDHLYARNESYFNIDRETYEKRKARNFDLDLKTKKWSILLLGIPERFEKLKKLLEKLEFQIKKNGLKEDIEILALIDNRNRSVGNKRQALLDISQGEFISFIDDDDDISDEYVLEIHNAILKNIDVDVITFNQIAKINNNPESKIKFNLNYSNEEYFPNAIIKRKPFHMCVWNTRLTNQVKFPDISKTEDWFWIENLCKIAKTQYNIDKVLHFYIFNSEITTS